MIIDKDIMNLWLATPGWISDHSSQILVMGAIGAVIVGILIGLQRLGQRLTSSRHVWRAAVGRSLAAMRLWFMIALVANIIAVYAHAPADIARIISVVFIIASTFQAAFILRELILGVVEIRAGEADPSGSLGSAMGIIRLLVSTLMFIVAIIFILSNLGIDATGLVAGLGIGGIAIGLAAQGIFADLFAALSILFDQPFKRGDIVRYEGTTGVIEAIGLKSTRIRALSGEEVIISNTNLLSKELRNFARADHRRIFQTLGLIYQTPITVCAALPDQLQAIVAAVPGGQFVRAGLTTFGASSLDFDLVYDIASDDPDEILRIKNAVNLGVLTAFGKAGIAFAYPTQTTFTAAPDGVMVLPYTKAR